MRVKAKILQYLKEKKGKRRIYRTNYWIALGTGVPQPSVRRATKELSEDGKLSVDDWGFGSLHEIVYSVR